MEIIVTGIFVPYCEEMANKYFSLLNALHFSQSAEDIQRIMVEEQKKEQPFFKFIQEDDTIHIYQALASNPKEYFKYHFLDIRL